MQAICILLIAWFCVSVSGGRQSGLQNSLLQHGDVVSSRLDGQQLPDQNGDQQLSDQNGGQQFPDQSGGQQFPDQNGGQQFSDQNGGQGQQFSDQNGAQQFPDQNGGQQFPGQNGGQQFPDQNGGQGFPDENGGQGFPDENGGQGFPNKNGGQGFPDQNGGQGFPDQNGGQGFPNKNRGQGFPDQNGGQGFPDQNGGQGFPDQNGKQGFPDQNGGQGFPDQTGGQGFPDQNSGQQFPDQNGGQGVGGGGGGQQFPDQNGGQGGGGGQPFPDENGGQGQQFPDQNDGQGGGVGKQFPNQNGGNQNRKVDDEIRKRNNERDDDSEWWGSDSSEGNYMSELEAWKVNRKNLFEKHHWPFYNRDSSDESDSSDWHSDIYTKEHTDKLGKRKDRIRTRVYYDSSSDDSYWDSFEDRDNTYPDRNLIMVGKPHRKNRRESSSDSRDWDNSMYSKENTKTNNLGIHKDNVRKRVTYDSSSDDSYWDSFEDRDRVYLDRKVIVVTKPHRKNRRQDSSDSDSDSIYWDSNINFKENTKNSNHGIYRGNIRIRLNYHKSSDDSFWDSFEDMSIARADRKLIMRRKPHRKTRMQYSSDSSQYDDFDEGNNYAVYNHNKQSIFNKRGRINDDIDSWDDSSSSFWEDSESDERGYYKSARSKSNLINRRNSYDGDSFYSDSWEDSSEPRPIRNRNERTHFKNNRGKNGKSYDWESDSWEGDIWDYRSKLRDIPRRKSIFRLK